MKKTYNYWTKEKCHEISLKYKTIKDFKFNNDYVYIKSFKNNWLNEICNHMVDGYSPKKIWTKDKCISVSNNCNNRKEFREKFKSAYTACYRNGWLGELIGKGYKSHGYWTKENCHIDALNYKTRTEYKNSSYSYRIATENDWLNDICKHMITIGNLMKRCIYVYEFEDNFVYVGLTFNIEDRKDKHNKRGPVYEHIKETNSSFEFKKLTNYIDVDKAKELENFHIDKYTKKGWSILNKIKGGGIGGIKK